MDQVWDAGKNPIELKETVVEPAVDLTVQGYSTGSIARGIRAYVANRKSFYGTGTVSIRFHKRPRFSSA